jgi:hypothetical protein
MFFFKFFLCQSRSLLGGHLSKALTLSVKVSMPPKRTASTSTSTSKRKASPSDDEDAPKVTKKSKVSTASAPRYSDQPTNKVLPVNIDFPPRIPNTLRFATWNIAGLAASQKKGFKYYLEAEDPDILVLTETKVRVITRLLVCKPNQLSGEQCASGPRTEGTFPTCVLDNIRSEDIWCACLTTSYSHTN